MLMHMVERRRQSDRHLDILAGVLDEVDYGLLLLNPQLELLHMNHAAESELDENHPLLMHQQHLFARDPRDATPLREALQDAASRGLRRMVVVGAARGGVRLSVVPLRAGQGQTGAVLVVLARRQMVSALAAQAFARAYQLSRCEEQVLLALCQGQTPQEIAEQHGVKIATVRTQVASVRSKTGVASIRDLVQQVACLPPLVGSLRQCSPHREGPRLAA
ncbi:helix-turn-helix transcriptional regulator [Ideonella paludis]|uniref:Helix-turn-helix transcriptional regulator n=1 Tax=Ideonella paludis TaxID=1233411 RepID=A0ABS5DTH6_9BURK|nr:LuxR C-terminal-related transcriptional regulator [Ideonella paludis]MBQ0934448.1 helix-turn-helix transcriptional regulator [Ideonella paludis]